MTSQGLKRVEDADVAKVSGLAYVPSPEIALGI